MASPVLLSPRELIDLKRMCANPFMELGSTLRPEHLQCFKPYIVTTTTRVVISFPSNEAAKEWNLMHLKRIRMGGHLATIALTGIVALLGGGSARTIATGSTLAIAKDEIQAKVWYPEVSKGWRLTRDFRFRYQQFPDQYFQMEWTDVIHDEDGSEHERRVHAACRLKVGEPFGIPEDLVREIMTRLPSHVSRKFH